MINAPIPIKLAKPANMYRGAATQMALGEVKVRNPKKAANPFVPAVE